MSIVAVQIEALWAGLLDNSGNPISGGKVYTYEAGTSTDKDTYTDRTKLSTAANPIILDSYGRAEVYADGLYKFVVKDSDDVTLYDVDNLEYLTNEGGDITASSVIVDSKIKLDDNNLTSAETNGSIDIIPTGTGDLNIAPVSGQINIGPDSGDTVIATIQTNQDLDIQPNGTGKFYINKASAANGIDVIRDEDDMASDDANALATQQSIKAYTDNQLASFQAKKLFSQAIKNGNFDIWTIAGTSFTDPADGAQLANWWTVVNTDGGGTAPAATISRDTDVPSNGNSTYACKVNVTATGSASSTTEYALKQTIQDYTKFKGKTISIALMAKDENNGETIEIVVDDGVTTTLLSRETLTSSYVNYTYENIAISASASELTIYIRIAGGTGLTIASSSNFVPGATGAFFFTQAQLGTGTTALTFEPKSFDEEAMCRFASGVTTVTGSGGDVTVNLPFNWTGGYLVMLLSDNASDFIEVTSSSISRLETSYDALTNSSYTNYHIFRSRIAQTDDGIAKTTALMGIPNAATPTSFTLDDNTGTTTYVKWFVFA